MIDHTLSKGQHKTREDGMCAMEFVAHLGGEEHSDRPKCVDPALRRFVIGLNDNLPDDLRQQLRPYLARMIGTAGDGRTEERLYMLAEWTIRVAETLQVRVVGPWDTAAASVTGRLAKAPTFDLGAAGIADDAIAVTLRAAGVDTRAMWVELLPSALELLDRMLPAEAIAGSVSGHVLN